ncbi:hypothetical protein PCE1_002620 [Barthelona sp. PCE]
MPRIRRYEDDLIVNSHPEGRIIFEGQGVTLLSSEPEIFDISRIETFEGKEFIGFVGDIQKEPLKYISKQKVETGFIIVKKIGAEFEILFFDSITSDEYTSKRVPFPLELNGRISKKFIPLDANHFLFTMLSNHSKHCYLFSTLTEQHRYLGEFDFSVTADYSFVLLKKLEDDSIWHYNFTVDDMDELRELDIKQLDGVNEHTICSCANSDCVLYVSFGSGIEQMIIIDRQRNRVDLIERFCEQLKNVKIDYFTNFVLFTLTENVFTAMFSSSLFCTLIHIENGELKMSCGEMKYCVSCIHSIHLNLTNDFCDRDCVIYGASKRTGVCGSIKFRSSHNEVLRLNKLCPLNIYFNGIVHYSDDDSRHYFFFFKEKKIIIVKDVKKKNLLPIFHKVISYHVSKDCHFYVMLESSGKEQGTNYTKIQWKDCDIRPIVEDIPSIRGSEFFCFILGLPINTIYDDDENCLIYLGDTLILELDEDNLIYNVFGTITGDSVCIYCTESIHFFRFLIENNNVKVEKHIIIDHDYNISQIHFFPHPMDTINHQLFVVDEYGDDFEMKYLYCLDWSTESVLEPFTLFKQSLDGEELVNLNFKGFVSNSHIRLDSGVARVSIFEGAITLDVFNNSILPHVENIYTDLNQPNGVIQTATYEAYTKSVVLNTYNIEEDPESTNTEIDTFHLPSFLSETFIVEYCMPYYHSLIAD